MPRQKSIITVIRELVRACAFRVVARPVQTLIGESGRRSCGATHGLSLGTRCGSSRRGAAGRSIFAF
jgi:hypothetical protein